MIQGTQALSVTEVTSYLSVPATSATPATPALSLHHTYYVCIYYYVRFGTSGVAL